MEFRTREAARGLAVMVTLLVTGCATGPVDPMTWTISPDAYGPVTTAMTAAEIQQAAPFVPAPSSCGLGRLDWHSQMYEPSDVIDGDGKPGFARLEPYLASITLDGHGKPGEIDPNPKTATDKGIRRGDSLNQLKAAYGDRLISEKPHTQLPDEAMFAVNGKRSHLAFSVYKGKVVTFYLTPGKAADPYVADMRGVGC